MHKTLAVVILAGLASAGASVPTLAGCECRGNGKFYEQGELACIRTNAGVKLARCGMNLNNSSWIILRDDCPEAIATPVPDRLALAPHAPPDGDE